MANSVFHLSILTPDRVLFDGEASYLYAPGGEGYMGILAWHASLVSSLVPGRFEVRVPGKPQIAFKTSAPGLLEVHRNDVSVLLDTADSAVFSSGTLVK